MMLIMMRSSYGGCSYIHSINVPFHRISDNDIYIYKVIAASIHHIPYKGVN